MRLTEELARMLKMYMPEETILLAPTMGEGRRLLHTVAEGGQLLLGVRAATPESLAMEICAEIWAEDHAPRLPENGEAQDLIYRILKDMPEEGFFALPHAKDRRTAELILQVIGELDANDAPRLSGNERLEALQQVRDAWKTRRGEDLLNREDLLKLAARKAEGAFAGRNVHFIALSTSHFDVLQKQLIDVAAGKDLQILPVQVPEKADVPERCLAAPLSAADINRSRLRFVRCRGRETEAKFIMRDILNNGIPAEDCAVIYLSPEYADLLYTEAAFYRIPISMSGGIPLSNSMVHMTLRFAAEWADSNYDAEALRTLMLSGAISLPETLRFVERLRSRKIGWGEERYFSRFLQAAEEENQAPDPAVLDSWRTFLETLFSVVRQTGSLEEQKTAIRLLLDRCARTDSLEEASARMAAEDLLDSVTWLDAGETVLKRLLDRMENGVYLKQNETPGKLFAVPLSEAFCTGRKVLYLCGMSRFCMQGSRQESPLLLDDEKKKYGLMTLRETEQENTFRFLLLLFQHQGGAVLSFSDYDTERMIELQPSSVYRQLRGEAEPERITCAAQYDAARPLSFADPVSAGKALKTTPETAGEPDENTVPAELAAPLSYADQLGRMSFSPSSLEQALSCPLKFYLQRVLGLTPERLPEQNSDAWLDAAEMGTLCHAVLERYYSGEGETEQIFAEELEKLTAERPSARPTAMQKDIDRARAMVERAIRWTDDEHHEVIFTEKPFGRLAGGDPLRIRVKDREIGLSGSIDRVDRLQDGSFAVLDYKTGISGPYRDHETIKLQPYLYARALEEQNAGITVSSSGYLFLKNAADYFPVSQDPDARQNKENVLTSLLDWMQEESRAMTAAPAFVISGDRGIESVGSPEDRRSQYGEKGQSGCGRWCDFASVCSAAEQIRKAEEAEPQTSAAAQAQKEDQPDE